MVWEEVVVAAIKKGNSDKMAAFMSAAMVLPGMVAQAQDAGVRSDKFALSYNRSQYTESGSRMDIAADQFSLNGPVGDRFELKANIVKDVMSGASPEYYDQGADGKPVQVLQSGASIRDERNVLELSGSYYGDDQYVAIGVGRSEEDDYDAQYYSIEYRRDMNDKNTTLLLGAVRSSDDVWRADFPGQDVRHRTKTDLLVGVNQILDRNSTIQISFTQSNSSGALSDPYKRAFVGDLGGAILESRPGNRRQSIFATRYSRYLEASDSGLHVDLRYAFDDWQANSVTAEVKWNKEIGDGWMLSPSVRYYSQSSAKFYDLFFNTTPADGHFSADYRLAGFGAVSAKLGVTKTVSDEISLSLKFEHYARRYALVLDNSAKGHEVDDFSMNLISFSLNIVF